HAFVFRPGGVGVEQHLGMRDVRDRLVHGLPRQSGRRRVILSPLSMLAIFGRPVELRAAPRRSGTMVASRSRNAGDAMTRQMLRHWQEAVPNDRLAHLVKHAARGLARALQMRLAEHSVSYGHWTFLRVLWEAEGLTQRQLSDEAAVMEPTTFSALNAMEKLGYVVRRPSPTSRKELHVYLTPRGRAPKTKLVPLAQQGSAGAAGGGGDGGRVGGGRPGGHGGEATDVARAHCESGGRGGRIAHAAPAYPVDGGIVAAAQRLPPACSESSAAPPRAREKESAWARRSTMSG